MVEIREPDVLKTPFPKEEPVCRVGIVLEEDNKTFIEMDLGAGEYHLEADQKTIPVKFDSRTSLSIKVSGDHLECGNREKGDILKTQGFLRLIPRTGKKEPSPRSGILMKGIVAGRGFHWQKEVDLTFPDQFEFHNRNGKLVVVNVLPMESYLTCVVTSEMSATCPPEFIKAQATAARSWMLVFLKNKHIDEPFSICNDDCCQRYQGTTHLSEGVAQHVAETRGMCIVTYEGYICGAYYSKSCGGIMESARNIFGEGAVGISAATDAPPDSPTALFNPITEENAREWIMGDFLKKSDSFCSPNTCPEEKLPQFLGAVDEAGHYYRWQKQYAHEELVQYLKTKAEIKDIAEFIDFQAKFRGNSGRIHELEVLYKDSGGNRKKRTIKSQYQIRNALHEKFLFSSAFVWDFEKDDTGKIMKIVLHGAGWGHGVGLCQIGALGMALKGYSYTDILKHYYGKTSLVKAY
ncbi:SpoIID/LytB domain-containing protein [Candidatus Sumerlaeota bacterium]|nr:SpoIID/LytB domain-containing protein [Candidatus Sumerlaeota bacterium]